MQVILLHRIYGFFFSKCEIAMFLSFKIMFRFFFLLHFKNDHASKTINEAFVSSDVTEKLFTDMTEKLLTDVTEKLLKSQ